MRYVPPSVPITPPGRPTVSDHERACLRAELAERAKRYGNHLWKIDDAEAQLRWAIADATSHEHIAYLKDAVNEAYLAARPVVKP